MTSSPSSEARVRAKERSSSAGIVIGSTLRSPRLGRSGGPSQSGSGPRHHTRVSAPSDVIISDEPELDSDFIWYTPSCGTDYSLTVTTTKAVAGKGDNGFCDGDAWLPVHGDTLGQWRNDESRVILRSPNGQFKWAYIRDCTECDAYIV